MNGKILCRTQAEKIVEDSRARHKAQLWHEG